MVSGWGWLFSAPDYTDRVLRENTIGSENGQFFENCLSNDQSVEGVVMVRWEVIHFQAVRLSDGKGSNALIGQSLGNVTNRLFR